jgi:zinc/manganese transport system substrate-binding protein
MAVIFSFIVAKYIFFATNLQKIVRLHTIEPMRTPATLWRLAAGIIVLTGTFAAIWRLAQPHAAQTVSTGKIQVVAAENFWGDIASQLGGGHIQVTSIISDPNTDPHLYESSAENASAVNAARIVIANGLGYDDFISKLLAASPKTDQQVLTVSDILHAPIGANQHLWYDIPRIHIVASSITDALITADPDHKTDYKNNLIAFNISLGNLQKDIDTIERTYPHAPVAFTEPVPVYVLAAAGLDNRTPEGFAKAIEEGNDPSPGDTNAMEALLRNKQIKALLYNAQATSPVTEHIKGMARQNGIPVIGVTETLPAHESYQSWQHKQLSQLLQALGGSI